MGRGEPGGSGVTWQPRSPGARGCKAGAHSGPRLAPSLGCVIHIIRGITHALHTRTQRVGPRQDGLLGERSWTVACFMGEEDYGLQDATWTASDRVRITLSGLSPESYEVDILPSGQPERVLLYGSVVCPGDLRGGLPGLLSRGSSAVDHPVRASRPHAPHRRETF